MVLLDIELRYIDGFALFQALKKVDENVIICFMTINMLFIEQLKEKILHIEKYVVLKPNTVKSIKKIRYTN